MLSLPSPGIVFVDVESLSRLFPFAVLMSRLHVAAYQLHMVKSETGFNLIVFI